MQKVEVMTKELEKNEPQAGEVLEVAQAFEIVDFDGLRLAVQRVRDIGTFKASIEDAFGEHISGANKQHKSLISKQKKFLDAPEKAEAIYRELITSYVDETGDVCDGVSYREEEGPVFDDTQIKAVAKLVGAGKLPATLLKMDSKALKNAVGAGFGDIIPGLTTKTKKIITIRKAKA